MSHPASVPRAPDLITPERTAAVDAAITSRRSIRRFLPTEVPRAVVEDILRVASRAPSGTNTQPWRVHVLTGDTLRRVVEAVCAAFNDPAQVGLHQEEYDYYPKEWISPFIDRRRKVGWDLYSLLGIAKGDKVRMHEQTGRNFRFFDAPVGIMVTIDKVLGRGSLVDCGMFLQNLMVAARGHGLDTCPQAAWNGFARIILPHIGAGEGEMLVCGMALGHADPDDKVNGFHTPREPVSSFTRWLD